MQHKNWQGLYKVYTKFIIIINPVASLSPEKRKNTAEPLHRLRRCVQREKADFIGRVTSTTGTNTAGKYGEYCHRPTKSNAGTYLQYIITVYDLPV